MKSGAVKINRGYVVLIYLNTQKVPQERSCETPFFASRAGELKKASKLAGRQRPLAIHQRGAMSGG